MLSYIGVGIISIHIGLAKSLSARLPLVENRLTIDLFARAAARASLNTEFLECTWKNIKADMLPAIILTNDQKAHLLIIGENNEFQVITPDRERVFQKTDEIEKDFSGQVILIEPEYQFTDRASETLLDNRKNWFWQVFLKSLPIYSEVLVASFLINLFALVMPLFVMIVYDRVVPNNAIETLWVLVSGVFLVFLFDFILKQLRSYFIDIACAKSNGCGAVRFNICACDGN